MNYIEYKFSFTPLEPWREIFLALLAESAFESFEDTENGMNAFIRKDLDNEQEVVECIEQLSEVNISYIKTEIEQVNWNEVWESGFNPILVNDHCYIRAEFHPERPEIPYEIIIQPKMSFGTGHHETTHLMVEYILEFDFEGKDVLDMGCGTSILAILAKMKGANYVEAIDIDEWATENSVENAERNGVKIKIRQGDANILGDRMFDVIIANIQRNILMEDIPKYAKVLNFAGGELILSGLLEEDFNDISEVCAQQGLKFISKKQKNEWIALRFIKN